MKLSTEEAAIADVFIPSQDGVACDRCPSPAILRRVVTYYADGETWHRLLCDACSKLPTPRRSELCGGPDPGP